MCVCVCVCECECVSVCVCVCVYLQVVLWDVNWPTLGGRGTVPHTEPPPSDHPLSTHTRPVQRYIHPLISTNLKSALQKCASKARKQQHNTVLGVLCLQCHSAQE